MYAFAATIFLSAYLLFFVQPMIARFILPWFGGAPAVWTTCMMFFQLTLLGGYFYADWLNRRFALPRQVLIHTVISSLGLLFLPVIPAESWKPAGAEQPVGRIVFLLAATVGWPYFVLSTTGPLLQSWFSLRFPGYSPYRLYALSNVGSLLALVGYPFLVEPLLGTRPQAWVWSGGFVSFLGLLMLAGWQTRFAPKTTRAESASSEVSLPAMSQAGSRRLDWWKWLGLAMVPSVLLLAVTNELCQDVAVIPFLWIVPLSLYLLSFIVCFDRPAWYQRWIWISLLYLSSTALLAELFSPGLRGLLFQLSAFNLCLFSACMVCHGELAMARPPATRLTRYYLAISLGGALGGLFVVFVAPRLFVRYYELHWSLVAALLIGLRALLVRGRQRELALVARCSVLGAIFLGLFQLGALMNEFQLHRWSQWAFGLIWLAGGVIVWNWLTHFRPSRPEAITGSPTWRGWGKRLSVSTWVALGGLVVIYPQTCEWLLPIYLLCFAGLFGMLYASRGCCSDGPPRTWADLGGLLVLLGCGAGYLWEQANFRTPGLLNESRDFYGLVSAADEGTEDLPRGILRKLYSGRIVHGMQFRKPDQLRHPISYYGAISGVGRAVAGHPRRLAGESLRIGVVGLGAGVMAAWSEPGDQLHFFEINRQIRDYALEYFSYLDDSPAAPEVWLGDGRLLLEQRAATPQFEPYHLLVIDAFSGDSIPRHLLTRECFELDRKALEPDEGILALHITNGHFDLAPVVLALAEDAGWSWLDIVSQPQNNQADVGQEESRWILLSRRAGTLESLRAGAPMSPEVQDRVLWTDDFGSPVQLLKR